MIIERFTERRLCVACGGKGTIPDPYLAGSGVESTCPACQGSKIQIVEVIREVPYYNNGR